MKYGYRAAAKDLTETYFKTVRRFRPEVSRRIMLGTYALSAVITTLITSRRKK